MCTECHYVSVVRIMPAQKDDRGPLPLFILPLLSLLPFRAPPPPYPFLLPFLRYPAG